VNSGSVETAGSACGRRARSIPRAAGPPHPPERGERLSRQRNTTGAARRP